MKKAILKAMSIVMALILCTATFSAAFAAEGVPDGYTAVYSAEDLNNIRNNLSGKYILMNDIDLSAYENWEPIGTSENPFCGELDGNGFLIRNLKIQKNLTENKNYVGLFGVATDCLFKKTIVENGYIGITGNENVNVFIGTIVGGIISEDYSRIVNCAATGKIEVTGCAVVFAGGLAGVGIGDNCILSSSNYAQIKINTQKYAQKIYIGGLLGGAAENKDEYAESYYRIEKSANFGEIILNNSVCSEESEVFAGGIAGFQISGNELSQCYNRGTLTSTAAVGKLVFAGILGEAINKLETSYNVGKINVVSDGNDSVSAISFIEEPYISFPEGSLTLQNHTVYNCYYSNSDLNACTQDSGDTHVLSKNNICLSETDFKEAANFASFDFDAVWSMEENGYPVLKNQPQITVKEKIDLENGKTYAAKAGKLFETNNAAVASVDGNGIISATGAGTTVITVNHEYGYKTEYTVNVTAKSDPTTEPSTEPTTEPTTKPTEDVCTLADICIVKFLKRVINSICNFFVLYIFPIFGA